MLRVPKRAIGNGEQRPANTIELGLEIGVKIQLFG
jgi:hypothetical protein